MAEHPYEQPLFAGLYRQVRGSAQGLKPDILGTLMERMFGAIDHTVDALKQQDPPATPTACQAECNYCCSVQVQLLPPEILYIADHLKQFRTEAELQQLVDRVSIMEDQISGLSAVDRARVGLPCPLLENDRCSVYDVRPITCRAANSSDAERCKAAIGPEAIQDTVPSYTHQVTVCRHVTRALLEGFQEIGFATPPLELVSALRIVLTNDDAFSAWVRGEPVFAKAIAADPPVA